jgi:hypothetical protein
MIRMDQQTRGIDLDTVVLSLVEIQLVVIMDVQEKLVVGLIRFWARPAKFAIPLHIL